MLDRIRTSIFLVLVCDDKNKVVAGRGTAFAIRPDLLVSCEHVVRDHSAILIAGEESIFDGKNMTPAQVVMLDKRRDLALLKVPSAGVHPLQLSTSEQLDHAMPLLVWTWPGWIQLETGKVGGTDTRPDLRCVPRAAVMTRLWPGDEGGVPLFSFAGRVEEGMSGGPIVSALTGDVIGVVTSCWPLDPSEIAENWRGNVEGLGWYDFSGRLYPPPDEIVMAQLGLGMGIALPVQELGALVKSLSPEGSTQSENR